MIRFVMILRQNVSLKPYNSFSVEASARYFLDAGKEEEILDFLRTMKPEHRPLFLLGGGSNVLFVDDFPGTILKIGILGINVVHEDSRFVRVNARAGEKWDDLVEFCVSNGWGGLENLSLIPGSVGAAPVQNIGAYGAELKNVLSGVTAVDLETLEKRIFSLQECEFGYRDSVFKSRLKDRYLILDVEFRLDKDPSVHTDYQDVRNELRLMGIPDPTIRSVRDAVIAVRRRKLPDPAVTGNCGSFFKNPVVSLEKFRQLERDHPGIVSYPRGHDAKLAAAWMIEKCGWKGFREGDAGVHNNQALVLVNHGNAQGSGILALAEKIRRSVSEEFGVELETEVNIIPSAVRRSAP
jgi:UDP-N-acetylmuramate dehydrogenase